MDEMESSGYIASESTREGERGLGERGGIEGYEEIYRHIPSWDVRGAPSPPECEISSERCDRCCGEYPELGSAEVWPLLEGEASDEDRHGEAYPGEETRAEDRSTLDLSWSFGALSEGESSCGDDPDWFADEESYSRSQKDLR